MGWTCLSSKHGVRARKEHQCFMCAEPIPAGTKYDRRSGVRDGQFVTMTLHPGCNETSSEWDDLDWETFSTGGMARGKDEPAGGYGG